MPEGIVAERVDDLRIGGFFPGRLARFGPRRTSQEKIAGAVERRLRESASLELLNL